MLIEIESVTALDLWLPLLWLNPAKQDVDFELHQLLNKDEVTKI
jgi:hypothetical protein